MNALIVSADPRIVDAVRGNLGQGTDARVSTTAVDAQNQLFADTIPLVFLDWDIAQSAPPGILVSIDNVVQKERGVVVLLCKKATKEAVELRDQFVSIEVAIDLSRGRDQFDEKARAALKIVRSRVADSYTGDGVIRHEVDLPAPEKGSLIDFPLARLLYTLSQRKETGRLKLSYSSHDLLFGVVQGDLVVTGEFTAASELLGAFSWSHGKYEFTAAAVDGSPLPALQLIAEGCRAHTRQRAITEAMTPVMRRYPVKTNLWDERSELLGGYDVLVEVMELVDGSTHWETALSSLGQRVTEGFRAAYLALQLDLVHMLQQPGLQRVAVNYSRAVRRARQAVDQAEVEKTKAFQATTGAGRNQLERELGVQLGKMRHMTPHEIFGVWEGCGRKVVQDRFYILVKEHHPDVYGGNTSGDVRSLAQDIFILVKNTYQELLKVEKAQTVAPPSESEVLDDSVPAALSEASEVADTTKELDKKDVKSRLSQMSGFRKKQRHRRRLQSVNADRARTTNPGRALSEAEVEEEESVPLPPEPESEPEPESDPEEDRKAKLNKLLKRAQAAGASPAADFWDKGFHAYKDGNKVLALEQFTKAWELDPESGPNLTFYGYLLFLNDPSKAAEAEELLRKALQTGNRQSAPDACLFLAHTVKAQGRQDEALGFYKRALRMNPNAREAEREIRLAERRSSDKPEAAAGSGLFKGLFKK